MNVQFQNRNSCRDVSKTVPISYGRCRPASFLCLYIDDKDALAVCACIIDPTSALFPKTTFPSEKKNLVATAPAVFE